ncbi:hypothetical protein CCMSSC00406_0003032 [Pleurotus cornucopiae]|uniref:Uncharacterized protein n=1 Tax=Pleurotus cornucopiae TaxID=5321 RepID=A0ACB7J647_PLECO|nr:hypothetical protein CCMSSC00406_0003032 [Pleurotus cornucopiae]
MSHSSGLSFENIRDQNMPGPSDQPAPPLQPSTQEMMMMMMDRLAQMEARYEQLAQYVRTRPPPTAPAPAPVPAPAPIPQPAEPARPVGPKLAKPEIFDGEHAKCRSFLRSIRMYIAVNQWQFTTENTKVLYALSFI